MAVGVAVGHPIRGLPIFPAPKCQNLNSLTIVLSREISDILQTLDSPPIHHLSMHQSFYVDLFEHFRQEALYPSHDCDERKTSGRHTDRLSSSKIPFIHHLQSNQIRKIRVVIARLANHPNRKASYIIRSTSNRTRNRIFPLFERQPFPHFQNDEKTAANYPNIPEYGQRSPNFPAFSHTPYLPLYTRIWTKNRRITS